MNKLTKAQAEYLIKRINSGLDNCCRIGHETSSHQCIFKIINQCTENDFPILNMYIRHEEHIKIYADIDDDRTILVVSADSAVSEFTPNQFKEYAAGGWGLGLRKMAGGAGETKWIEKHPNKTNASGCGAWRKHLMARMVCLEYLYNAMTGENTTKSNFVVIYLYEVLIG